MTKRGKVPCKLRCYLDCAFSVTIRLGVATGVGHERGLSALAAELPSAVRVNVTIRGTAKAYDQDARESLMLPMHFALLHYWGARPHRRDNNVWFGLVTKDVADLWVLQQPLHSHCSLCLHDLLMQQQPFQTSQVFTKVREFQLTATEDEIDLSDIGKIYVQEEAVQAQRHHIDQNESNLTLKLHSIQDVILSS